MSRKDRYTSRANGSARNTTASCGPMPETITAKAIRWPLVSPRKAPGFIPRVASAVPRRNSRRKAARIQFVGLIGAATDRVKRPAAT
jgi:hypothetical protein